MIHGVSARAVEARKPVRSMVAVAFGILGVAQAAAADLPAVLRGPIVGELVPAYRWSGVYGGGQVGYSVAGIDFAGSTDKVNLLVTDMLHGTTLLQDQTTIDQHLNLSVPPLQKNNPVGASFGGFVGYNWQWEDAITGAEINYNRTSLRGVSSTSAEGTFFDNTNLPTGHNNFYDVLVTGTAAAHITDWATFRARGGWAAGRFLPYGFVALAVGRLDVSRSASGTYSAVDVPAPAGTTPTTVPGNCGLPSPPSYSVCPTPLAAQREARNGVFAYGAAAGLGIDVALLPNLFLRGEWEWAQFAPVEGLHLHIGTIRTALGLKF
jgi:outer membrane immunogenic protein